MKKGDIVYSSGLGKTKKWNQVKGIITKVSEDKIYVKWDKTSYEDEMEYHEILKLDPNQLLRFSDGIEIFTGGHYRIIEEIDGLFVTGGGKLVPVKSRQEGEEIIRQVKEKDKQEYDKLFNTNHESVNVSLDELIQLNKISISNNYNRSLVDDFHLYLPPNSRFILRPILTHHHRNGVECESHIRYLISQKYPSNQVQSVIDLPQGDVKKMIL
jgi:hypothetical protein